MTKTRDSVRGGHWRDWGSSELFRLPVSLVGRKPRWQQWFPDGSGQGRWGHWPPGGIWKDGNSSRPLGRVAWGRDWGPGQKKASALMRDREAEPAGRTTPALLRSNIKGSSR